MPERGQSAFGDPTRTLPDHLAERVHQGAHLTARAHVSGEFVLYWARTALRAHENPALDVARTVAAQLGVPVFVYHALSERYPYASDRHHLFILEGARDFAAELAQRCIGTAFHLERAGHRGPHLVDLATRAALVVTERMPVAPLAEWTTALSSRCMAPVLEVDTACIVPMPLVTRAYDRAFAYRDATAQLRAARIPREWPAVGPHPAEAPQPFIPPLPFEPVDLANADFAALVATCRIDHSVAPVPHTRGGSIAGYARWDAFVSGGGLARYAATRNDPVDADGVSRMSAYLHYGMVSPMRLAREAHAFAAANGRGRDGAQKWLDELLVWRELAYTFCDHRPDHDTVAALPAWARTTLAAHEGDPRELLDWESLLRGRTPDAFWNAMQASLRVHGELHNNVRMTWGKAIPAWTPDAAAALDALIDLNHRYALDGRDPASFGGLLWCLGQFDRAFTPDNPVLGAVRGRDTRGQAERIDVRGYAKHVDRPAYGPQHVAVIGAGLAGLVCARTLADHGIRVTLFEKSRGVGGRCATRREGAWQFDHGAQYFTMRDRRLQRLQRAWADQGIIAPWRGRIAVRESGAWRGIGDQSNDAVERWVAVPGMSALARHVARDLDVHLSTQVTQIVRSSTHGDTRRDTWRVVDGAGQAIGDFDTVLVTVPSPQAARLLADAAPVLASAASSAIMHPTWAGMLVFEHVLEVPFDAAFVNDDAVLGWVARNGSKPGRTAHESWVLHANRRWSREHLEDEPEDVARRLAGAFGSVVGSSATLATPATPELSGTAPIAEPVFRTAHRWRHAIPDPGLESDCLYDADLGIGTAGDWCGGPRIEGALLSGIALAGRVLTAAHVRSESRPASSHLGSTLTASGS